jgi:hypothetical protein
MAELRVVIAGSGQFFALAFAMIYLAPWAIGYGLVLSLDTLLGFVVSHIGLWVILGGTIFTLYPTLADFVQGDSMGFIARAYAYGEQLRFENMFINTMGFAFGVMIAMVVIPTLRNWNHTKQILGALAKEPPKEFDPDRPLSYRLTWIGFIGCFVATILFAASFGIYLPMFILFFVLMLAIILMLGRFIAESGSIMVMFSDIGFTANMGWYSLLASGMVLLFAGTLLGPLDSMKVTSIWSLTVQWLQWSAGAALAAGAIIIGLVVAKRKKIMAKQMFMAAIIAFIIVLPIQYITRTENRISAGIIKIIVPDYLWICNWPYIPTHVGVWDHWMPPRGIARTIPLGDPLVIAVDGSAIPWANLMQLMSNPAWQTSMIAMIVAGLVVGILIPRLRARWTWLRVSLGGLVLGAIWGYQFWSAFYLALLIKYVITRYKGVAEFDKKWLPLAIGMFCGQMLVWWLWGDNSLIRWIWTAESWARGTPVWL